MSKIVSRVKSMFMMLLYVSVYVMQLLMLQVTCRQYAIVNATLNLMTYVFGVSFASAMAIWTLGPAGLRQAWDPRQVLRFLPVGIIFGCSSGVLYLAYAHHVPASIVTVLGFIYLPVSAVGKRILWTIPRTHAAVSCAAVLAARASSSIGAAVWCGPHSC